jgi:thiamine biosynthesis lipoprotein
VSGRAAFASAGFPALGTTASVIVTDARAQDTAVAILRAELDAIDRAASRFRDESELVALNHAEGQAVRVSDLLFRAVTEGVRAAELTCGLVDPTVGEAMAVVGYDRDFDQISGDGPPLEIVAKRVPGWRVIALDPQQRTVRLPHDVRLDLGATAKALCADLAAERVHHETGVGVLVNLGGDIAVHGPTPEDGWSIRVTHNHADPPRSAAGPVISLQTGGLATSSTTVRRWSRGGSVLHHLVDPATGLPAERHWCTASVAAATCLDANIASCASILLGAEAPAWLRERRLPARLVDERGAVTTVGGWSEEEPPACSEHG